MGEVGRSLRAAFIGVAGAVAIAGAPAAWATESSSGYNDVMPGQTHGGPADSNPAIEPTESAQCIWPVGGRAIAAWMLGGTNTGYRFDNLVWDGNVCRAGQVRVSRLPSMRINVGGVQREMYFQRGGGGSAPYGTTRDSVIRHAHIWVGDLQARPSVFSLSDPVIAPNGRGCAATTNLYRTRPRIIPGLYKAGSEGSRWAHYGDPPASQGIASGAHWSTMLWNWMWSDSTGGGQVRASIESGTPVRACDVELITSGMWAPAGFPNDVGYVRGMYGYIRDAAGTARYGWFPHSYKRNSETSWTYLLELANRCCLAANDRLNSGESLSSDNGAFRMTMQQDGNLVIYRQSDGAVMWHAGTFGHFGASAIMQPDGNFVVYNTAGAPVFHTNTYGRIGGRMVLQNDGNLVIYGHSNQVFWSRY